MTLKPSGFDPKYYGCPSPGCDWPLDPTTGEYEDTAGGVTCACGAFVALPDPPMPQPPKDGQKRALEVIQRTARRRPDLF